MRKLADAKAAQPKKKTGKADVILSLIQKLYGIEVTPCVRIVVASINFKNKQGAVS